MKYILTICASFFLFSCMSQKETVVSLDAPTTTNQETQTLLALGDSLTAGYGVEESVNYPSQLKDMLIGKGYNYEVINAGVSGDTSKNLLDRADLYLDKNPSIVLIVIGGNDGLGGLSTTDMKENVQKIVDIYKNTNAKIVLGGMDVPINLGLDYRADFRQVYKDLAKENKDIFFLPFFLEGVAGEANLNIPDRIHPNQAGYNIIVTNLVQFLEKEKILQK